VLAHPGVRLDQAFDELSSRWREFGRPDEGGKCRAHLGVIARELEPVCVEAGAVRAVERAVLVEVGEGEVGVRPLQEPVVRAGVGSPGSEVPCPAVGVVQRDHLAHHGQFGVVQFVHERRGETRGVGGRTTEHRAEGLPPGGAAGTAGAVVVRGTVGHGERHQAAQQGRRLGEPPLPAEPQRRRRARPGLEPALAFTVVEGGGTGQAVALRVTVRGAVRVQVLQRQWRVVRPQTGQGVRRSPGARVGPGAATVLRDDAHVRLARPTQGEPSMPVDGVDPQGPRTAGAQRSQGGQHERAAVCGEPYGEGDAGPDGGGCDEGTEVGQVLREFPSPSPGVGRGVRGGEALQAAPGPGAEERPAQGGPDG
jgi:hypothetical protein